MNLDPKMPTEANDVWAEVELFRWQHGKLPDDKSNLRLSIPNGLRSIAAGMDEGMKRKDITLMPSPFAVSAVLKYVARLLEDRNEPGKN